MNNNEILDVTVIEPRQKHPAIFDRFDSLSLGEFFTIKNDHDPKPLYYHLINEKGPIFTWEYLEEGPEFWQVRITKKQSLPPQTVGEIVAKDIRKARVFKKLGIDFCCGGNKTLEEVCSTKNLNIEEVRNQLIEIEHEAEAGNPRFNEWELDFLVDYIVENHHQYVSEAIPQIEMLAKKVANVHGNEHPEMKDVYLTFNRLGEELVMHMHKEERILFPYIKHLAESNKNQETAMQPPFGTVSNPIRMMESEHDIAGDLTAQIRQLTNGFTLPEDSCNSYKLLFDELKRFEADLYQHIHLENNILFPKAKELEIKLLG